MITFLKFVLGNLIFILVTTNLIGYSIRGFLQPREYRTPEKPNYFDTISVPKGIFIGVFSSLITIAFTYYVFTNYNIYILLGILLGFIFRVPDLLKEIKYGIQTNTKNIEKSLSSFLISGGSWLSFGVFNYGLWIYFTTGH